MITLGSFLSGVKILIIASFYQNAVLLSPLAFNRGVHIVFLSFPRSVLPTGLHVYEI